ncbi:MAG: efflux RND transporter periplasmic adaptor subunit [Schleiferiaceae bacterium]|nr:efflux RND transporter periplasmic adaptor subunit [Schleiferiaceae bacterium]MDR9441405.1 efflux RND transporter periplasmic adaptor subunit [Schleiferiaceae bacterium]
MNKKLKIGLLIGIPLLVLLVVAKKQGWIGQEDGLSVETFQVKKQDITQTVLASGKIQPEVEVKISAEVSGEITALPVVEGQRVEKGDLLIKINPDLFQAAVNRTQAAVNSALASKASAEAQLLEAEKNFNRNKKLHQKDVISDAEFDASQRAYDVARLGVQSARYQLESARASLKEARDNLERTTIYAPQAGTVTLLNSEVGERVVGTAQMAGTEIMRVSDLENMEVVVQVNENDIIRLEKNDTARIEVDAYLDKTFKGVVTEIANSANLQTTSVDQVTNYEVKVRILPSSYRAMLKEGQQSPFRPGMTASVEIITQRKNGVLAVPVAAVTTRTDTADGKRFDAASLDEEEEKDQVYEVVFLREGNQAQLQVVTTGIQDQDFIEVKSGLEEDQTIISGPYSAVSRSLSDGKRIQVEEEAATKNADEET